MILDYLKKYEKGAIITSILLIIISIFLIAIPGIVLSTLVTVFGIIFFAEGLINIISYIFEDKEIRAFSNELILGIILLVFGLIILLNQVAFISILPIIIGMWLIIKSVMKFQLAINLKSMMTEKWGWVLASAILMFIFGVLIVLNPFATVITLTRFANSKIEIVDIQNLRKPKIQKEEIKIIVASLRLDNIVSDLARTSRNKAVEIIKQERVFMNGQNEIKVSKQVKMNDIITIRGKGRFIIKEIAGTTRSGRPILTIEKYV